MTSIKSVGNAALAALLFCCGPALHAQDSSAEVTTQDSQPSFTSRTNLVLVRVVVRDANGAIVGTLKKDDFQLFDKNKPQLISNFSIEKPGQHVIHREDITGDSLTSPGHSDAASHAALPERYVAYLFDDVHLAFGDLARVRKAAEHQLAGLSPTDRVAVYTTSGLGVLDFTDDRAALQAALLRLQPRPIGGSSGLSECPDISYYMADLIQNKNDTQALQAAEMEINTCQPPPQSSRTTSASAALQAVEQQARAAASRELGIGTQQTNVSLSALSDTVRRLSAMPGQRTLVIVSPGFLVLDDLRPQESTIIDRALRSNIVISGIDARGLYTVDTLGDISKPVISNSAAQIKSLFLIQAARAQADLLAELADSTGGTFFQNNNDLMLGFERATPPPETYYVLGFSPQNLKFDGSFHKLKVGLKDSRKLTLQARRGYYAPKRSENADETSKREIEEALFSLDELHDIPLQLHTQFFKSSETDAKLSVVAHLDIRRIHYRKVDGRNRDDVTIVSGLFDRNGNFLMASEKRLELRLLDQTLESRLNSGVSIKLGFDVKPGSYMVRLVVRDTEGQQLSAQNGAVEIP